MNKSRQTSVIIRKVENFLSDESLKMKRRYCPMLSLIFLIFLFGGWFYTLTVGNHDGCRRLKFLEPIDGYVLIGYVLKNISLPVGVHMYSHCRNWCTMEDRCTSINMGPSQKDKFICQLSDSDHLQHTNDLKPMASFVYRGTVNKCYFNMCYNNATCLVGFTDKGYKCVCPAGYTGEHCGKDIDECAGDTHNCSRNNATCTNTEGSFNCSCKRGFTGNGHKCEDIDECAEDPHSCNKDNATCKNTEGSFKCSCKPGFIGDGHSCRGLLGFVPEMPAESCGEIKTSERGMAVSGRYWLEPQETNMKSKKFLVYCDMVSADQAWTLLARFSNSDTKNWMDDSGGWWYDSTQAAGETAEPSYKADMISPAFWLVSGSELKITRNDDSSHTPLLQTTGNCLSRQTFRSKITSYGDFRNGSVWSQNKCLGKCNVQYGGHYQETIGFGQASCSDNLQGADEVGFWCSWKWGGSVIMIGGGGDSCSDADHGIAITKAKLASFKIKEHGRREDEFGDSAWGDKTEIYSLNLWIR